MSSIPNSCLLSIGPVLQAGIKVCLKSVHENAKNRRAGRAPLEHAQVNAKRRGQLARKQDLCTDICVHPLKHGNKPSIHPQLSNQGREKLRPIYTVISFTQVNKAGIEWRLQPTSHLKKRLKHQAVVLNTISTTKARLPTRPNSLGISLQARYSHLAEPAA